MYGFFNRLLKIDADDRAISADELNRLIQDYCRLRGWDKQGRLSR